MTEQHTPPNRRRRSVSGILVALLLLGAGGYGVHHLLARDADSYGFTNDPVIERIEKVGKLAVLKIYVADIISKNDAGFFSGVDGIWIIKGDALLTVDFAQIQFLERDETAKTVTLRLSGPAVESARVDHDRSGVYQLDTGLFTGDEEASKTGDHAFKMGQESIRMIAINDENLRTARENAELLLKAHLAMVGWDARVVWAD